jgi:ribosomal protein S18 acetylase RimI-like enzyme
MKIAFTKDVDLISRLNQSVQEHHFSLNPEYFKPYHFREIRDFFHTVIEKPNQLFLLHEEKEPLGYAWIEQKHSPENPLKKEYKSTYVHQIGVIDSYRNKVFGIILLEKINQIAKEQGAFEVHLDYWSQNEKAERFYKKNGYKIYRESVHKLIM